MDGWKLLSCKNVLFQHCAAGAVGDMSGGRSSVSLHWNRRVLNPSTPFILYLTQVWIIRLVIGSVQFFIQTPGITYIELELGVMSLEKGPNILWFHKKTKTIHSCGSITLPLVPISLENAPKRGRRSILAHGWEEL